MRKILAIMLASALMTFSGCKKNSLDEMEEPENIFIGNKELCFIHPDRYNCGCDEQSLTKITEGMEVGGVKFSVVSEKYIGINLWNGDDVIPDAAVIENCDFSGYPALWIANQSKLTKKKTVTFRNCKFNGFRNGYVLDKIKDSQGNVIKEVEKENLLTAKFENCTFQGGIFEVNISLKRCLIKETYGDGCNPLKNFEVIECYFADLLPGPRGGTAHVDGTQTYGRKNISGGNILFKNTRMEIPFLFFDENEALKAEHGDAHYVNACIMFQLEYGDVSNVTYQDMMLNGGGFTIYIQPASAKHPDAGIVQKNINFKNIKVGCNHRWGKASNPDGMIYPNRDPKVDLSDIKWQDKLYVTSIYREGSKTYIVVSNDTNLEKTLRVVADNQEYEFKIPKNLTTEEMQQNTKLRFKDLPLDLIQVIDGAKSSITCYDGDTEIASARF